MGSCLRKIAAEFRKNKTHGHVNTFLMHEMQSDYDNRLRADQKKAGNDCPDVNADRSSLNHSRYQRLESDQEEKKPMHRGATYDVVADTHSPYSALKPYQKKKLNKLVEKIIDRATVDYNNPEFQDLQSAVHELLTRIVPKINERGIFNISRIQPCGSMVEKTAVWKIRKRRRFSGKTYTEFDFQAVLEGSTASSPTCTGCVRIVNAPVSLKHIGYHYKETKDFLTSSINVPTTIDNLFLQELTCCLVSLCDCLRVEYMGSNAPGHEGITH